MPGTLLSSVVLLHPTQSQRDSSAIYVVMRATRDTQSIVLNGEKLISTKFAWVGIEAPTWQMNAFTCWAIAPLCATSDT